MHKSPVTQIDTDMRHFPSNVEEQQIARAQIAI